jgi:hypothetical protein
MEQFYYAFIVFLLSIYIISRYYTEPEKLLGIIGGLFVLLSLFIGLDIYMLMLYATLGLLGYVIVLYFVQEGVIEFNVKKEAVDTPVVPYWVPVLVAQTSLTFVLFIRYYDALDLYM